MTRKLLSDLQVEELVRQGALAIASLPANRRIAIISLDGKSYRAVRTYGGMQIQSADRRRLIAERKPQPSVTPRPTRAHEALISGNVQVRA